MLDKEGLRKEFAGNPERFYSVDTFRKEGFARKKCEGCGKYFWSIDQERKFCGDSAHEPYSFIREKPHDLGYEEFWNKFSDYFKKNGHEVIEKYPVVSRWRQDLYFTIASIQDFQRIENGKMSFEYSANPLLVPQICLRFGDIVNVGVTGRHLSAFMMAGQHSFNYPKEGYWRDRTIELNYGLLTKVLGIKKEELTYVEDTWAMGDFSEYGPCLEFFAKGLELGNNVFTEFEYVNGKVNELKEKVVDVGWGFDRLQWFYNGTQTAYDSVFRKELEYIHRNGSIKPDLKLYSKVATLSGMVDLSEVAHGSEAEKELIRGAGIDEKSYYDVIKPMQAAYAIADHARCLLFAISDGALPSNVGGGYNLRIVLRRIFDFTERYYANLDIAKVMEISAGQMKNLYPGLGESIPEITKIIEVERARYNNMKSSAQKIVTGIVEKKEKLTKERMRALYESNGITPEFINSFAASHGMKLEIPEELYSSIIKGDFAEKRKEEAKKELDIDVDGLPKTEQLFYSFASEAKATVLKVEGDMIVLDKTPFYAESGGQEADLGTIAGRKVKEVKGMHGVIVHVVEPGEQIKEGAKVDCKVDIERRLRLMAHHTATHLISASARKVLGNHAWQEGARKSPNKAHIDVAHYEKLTDQQVRDIENTANGFILHGIRVKMEEMDRNGAESKFGFSIYQGHGVPAKRLRVVSVSDLDGNIIDAEACGGLHLMGRETAIGLIKIIATSRPHDGIDRIEFVAGAAAAEYMDSLDGTVRDIAKLAGLDRDKLMKGLEVQINETETVKRENKRMVREIAAKMAEEFGKPGKKSFIRELEYDRRTLRDIATKMVDDNEEMGVLLYNKTGDAVCIAGGKSGKGAVDMLKEFAATSGKKFTGGGSNRMAEGSMK